MRGEISHMEPGDAMIKQLKAKIPKPLKAAKKVKEVKEGKREKKSKKKSDKVKKVKSPKILEPEEDLGLESSGSSSSPSLTLTSSRDSGHASDSNSASRDSDDIIEESKPAMNQSAKIKKLSSRVLFFENAIKTAAVTTTNCKDNQEAPTRQTKAEEFLKAIEPKEEKKEKTPTHQRQDSATYSESSISVNSDDFDEPADPAFEEPKYGALYLSERDLKMEKKLTKQVAGEIDENGGNGISGVKKILRKKMNKWKHEKINIAVMGDSMSGKSSLIKALGGLISTGTSKFSGRRQSCHQPTECVSNLNDSMSLWELPPISMSGKYSKANYLEACHAEMFDIFIICSSTWFKKDQISVAQEISDEFENNVIFVRTKLDDSIITDRKSRPANHDEDSVANKVRTHCWEPLEKRYDSEINLFLISSFHLNKYDGPKLLHCLLKSISDPKEKKQYILNDAMTMSLPALSLDLISRKREMLLERVWKIAAISTISGMMPIAGYNLTADIELLQKEVSFYRTQLGVTDDVIEQSSNCPNLVPVWKLICHGNGLQSLLRQSSMEQDFEEFSKFMNKLPLIGGSVSFATTCSVLKYCLSELSAISIRFNELEIRKML